MTNNQTGFINESHKDELIEVFGEKGAEVAEKLAADPKATALSLLFADFAKGK